MRVRRISFAATLLLAAAWLVVPASADQQALERAKELYVTAAYDEALAVLDGIPKDGGVSDAVEAAEYRIFCLLALDRRDDAKHAIEEMISANPFYHLSEGQASPRIQTVFRDIRRQVFPAIVRRSYIDARAAFDRHDADAAARFERVVALLDDPDARDVPALADLRTVAIGFRDLIKAAPPASPSPAAPAAVGTTAPAADGSSSTAAAALPAHGGERDQMPSDTGETPASPADGRSTTSASSAAIVPPVPVYQPIPPWVASNQRDQSGGDSTGTLELLIDRNSQVTSEKLRKSINQRYDAELIRTARTWRFRPATKDGVPTPFLKVVDIQLIPK